VGNPGVVFHAFHNSVISTALFSAGPHENFGGVGDSDLQRRSITVFARDIFRADSVSLMVCASRSSEAKLTSGLRYFEASASDFNFSYGVA
jgi:hypothetical protein